ncbi:hypothetical protein BLX88_25870 [Bacillus obstructivus]|nr:hypothetical protein BLX88_25870 [Bacillus obstructivus]
MDKLTFFNRFSEIEMDFKTTLDNYIDFYDQSRRQVHEYLLKVVKSGVIAHLKSMTDELTERDVENLKQVFDVEYDEVMAITSYSSLNPFVWLRITSRKIKELEILETQFIQHFRSLLQEIKKVEQLVSNFTFKKRESRRIDTLLGIKYRINSLLEVKRIGEENELWEHLRTLLPLGAAISKNDFLSVITVNHDLRYWDGPENRTMKIIKELPDLIDYKTLQKAVFMDKIEHDQDCYLFDIFMDEMLWALDKHKEMTGEGGFEILEKITGEPIQTYTATTNIYGDVTVTPNRPKLQTV